MSPTHEQLQQVAQAASRAGVSSDTIREVIGRHVTPGAKVEIASVPEDHHQQLLYELDMLAYPGEVYEPEKASAPVEKEVWELSAEQDRAQASGACLPAFCSGTGQHHTNEEGKLRRTPYTAITFAEIQEMIDNPPSVDKSKGCWFIPSTLLSRNFGRQEREGRFGVLAADLDQDPRPLAEVADLVRGIVGGCNFEVYASRGAKADKQKGRILIELPRLVDHASVECLQHILADRLREHGIEVDQALMLPGQLVYLPNKGEFYTAHHERNAGVFDAEVVWAAELTTKRAARAAEEAEAKAEQEARATARAARLVEVGGDAANLGPIERYNRTTDVGALLSKHGYEEEPRRPGNWRHPASQSGNYSLQVTEAGGVYGLSSEDPLGAARNDGHALSPFDVLTKLEFGGDEAAARAHVGCHVRTTAAEDFGAELVVPDVVPAPEKHSKMLAWPPGIVGEIATYILNSSRMPVPSFAIAGALAVTSYLIRNLGYVAPSKTSLNLYQVLIGNTGKGKEDPRKAGKRLLDAMGDRSITSQVTETMSSGTALLRSLSPDPYLLMMSDEYGIFMQAAMKGKDEHRRDLVKELMSLYGLAMSFHAGKRYANPRENIPRIDNPYVVTLGTTTEEELFAGLNMTAINNGSANRNIYIYADVDAKPNRRPDTDVPQQLIDHLNTLFGTFAQEHLHTMHYGPGAEEVVIEFGDNLPTTGKFANLWKRAEENMIRVAGVLAFCDGKVVKVEHVRWAIGYIQASIKMFDTRSETQITEGWFDKLVSKALTIISDPRQYSDDLKFSKATRQGKMPRGKLSKLMKIKPRELDEVLQHLLETEQIHAGVEDRATLYWV